MALARGRAGQEHSPGIVDLLVAAVHLGPIGRTTRLRLRSSCTLLLRQAWTHCLIGSSGRGRSGIGAVLFPCRSYFSSVLSSSSSRLT